MMKKLLFCMTLAMLMVGVFAANALAMTMSVDRVADFNSIYGDRGFNVGTISITEDNANELTNGDTFTLILPDGVVWDRDNTKVYRYVDGNLDGELLKNTDFSYEDDRKIKFNFRTVSGNVETYEILGVIKLYGYLGDNISVTLWSTNLSSFSPKEVIVADSVGWDQSETISISAYDAPVDVTVGDKQQSLASIRIEESTFGCFKEEDIVRVTIQTEGVTFDNTRRDNQPYYYPVMWQRLYGDNIFTSAALENNKNAAFTVTKRSDNATSIKLMLRSISISDNAEPGDIVVHVRAGSKWEDVVVGRIVAKSSEQLEQEELAAIIAESQKAKIGRSVFKLNSVQYTFMENEAITSVAPYNRNGVTFLPLSTLASVLGITESNYVWNFEANKVTMKSEGGGIVLEMYLGSKDAMLNGVPITLSTAPEYLGTSICLPVREIATIFGYTVTWVPATKSIIIDPPTA